MTDGNGPRKRTPTPGRGPGAYPVGSIEDPMRPAFPEEPGQTPGFRVVASRRAIPADPVSIIRRFHRAPDGFVAFMGRSGDEGLKPLGSVKTADLEEGMAGLGSRLRHDAYFSVNAFYRPATRKQADLRYLNALYVDIDFHDPASSTPQPERMDEAAARAEASRPWGRALSAVLEAQDMRLIPPPSLLSLSGRGLWLFYLLVDPKTGLPPEAFPGKAAVYGALNRELRERLSASSEYLQADPNAADASRVTRVPGSRHASVNRRVEFQVQSDERGRGFVYGLDEIAELLGLDLGARKRTAGKSGRRVPARRAGWEARWTHLLDDLSTLERQRDGFGKGCRNYAIWVTAYVLRKLGTDSDAIAAEVLRRAATCRPPFPKAEARTALKSAVEATRATGANITIEVVRRWLHVTPDEERSLKTVASPGTRKARKAPSGRAVLRAARHAMLAKLAAEDLKARGALRSVRDYVFALDVLGVKVSHPTIVRDLKALGLRELSAAGKVSTG